MCWHLCAVGVTWHLPLLYHSSYIRCLLFCHHCCNTFAITVCRLWYNNSSCSDSNAYSSLACATITTKRRWKENSSRREKKKEKRKEERDNESHYSSLLHSTFISFSFCVYTYRIFSFFLKQNRLWWFLLYVLLYVRELFSDGDDLFMPLCALSLSLCTIHYLFSTPFPSLSSHLLVSICEM